MGTTLWYALWKSKENDHKIKQLIVIFFKLKLIFCYTDKIVENLCKSKWFKDYKTLKLL